LRELTDFELFFKENYSRFYFYALRFVDDKEACRDIVGDAFEYAWTSYNDKKVDNWKNYIFSFIRNQCIDYLRHRMVQEKYAGLYINMVSEEDSPEEVDERILAIRNAMKDLTPKTRLILQECFINKKKYREVAIDLEISESAVKKHIVQALKILRQKIVKKDIPGVNDFETNTSTDK
jgi:RNA polymerase sigma-70 factor (ECF subfamily)